MSVCQNLEELRHYGARALPLGNPFQRGRMTTRLYCSKSLYVLTVLGELKSGLREPHHALWLATVKCVQTVFYASYYSNWLIENIWFARIQSVLLRNCAVPHSHADIAEV